MRIILAGATGLIGGLVLRRLSARDDVSGVTTISRRDLPQAGARHTQILASVEHWPDRIGASQFDVAICCLGTTMRAAGSKDAFVAVDHDAVLGFARAGLKAGVRQFLLVSSVGADAGARNFYLATKGRAEADICALGFGRLDIFRPGLLVGQRSGAFRMGERIAMALSPVTDLLTPNVLLRYRSIPSETVAASISDTVGAGEPGVFVHHNDDMRASHSKTD